jgi:transcriptional regulator with XRE-family HTH domain
VENEVATKREIHPPGCGIDDYQYHARRWVHENLKRLGWSQSELSRQMGKKDPSYIGHSMRGARNFKAEEIAQMEKLFGRSLMEAKAERFSIEQLRAPANTQAEDAAPHHVQEKLKALNTSSLSPREALDILYALNPVLEKLAALDTDSLSPREALDLLYALKKELR